MKTWNDYKEYVKSLDSKNRQQMEELEEAAAVIGDIIEQKNLVLKLTVSYEE